MAPSGPRLRVRCATSAAALAAVVAAVAPVAAARPADRDRDRLPDRWEHRFGLSAAKRSAALDPDRDRLANRAEYRLRTHPRRRDTDGDGIADGVEVRRGTNPRRPDSRPRRPDGAQAYVDIASRGGACSDARSAAVASSPATPWCGLERAVAQAPAGAVVFVRAGDYPRFSIPAARSGTVTLRPLPGERAVLSGGTLSSAGVRFEGLRITGTVSVQAPARSVAFVGNDWITDGRSGWTSLNLTAGVADVLVESNLIGQAAGAPAVNAINFSSTDTRAPIVNVSIRGNRIGPVLGGGDAIQAKNTNGLLVEGNDIFGISRPEGSSAHTDVFQSIYGATDLTLRGNFIHDVAAQGIFVQNFRGANSNVQVENNVIARVSGPWVEVGVSANGARIWHNTVDGLVRFSGTGVDLVANIATGGLLPSASPQVTREDHNLSTRFWATPGPASIVGKPTFRTAARNDFALADGSLGRSSGPNGTDIGAIQASFPAP